MTNSKRRVVITGMGLITPLGHSADSLWNAISHGQSGVRALTAIPADHLPSDIGGECQDFDGTIGNFGELEKKLQRSIKKGLKLMCRDIQLGVAAAQLALADAGINSESAEPERIGTLFGSDYIMTSPAEFATGIKNCSVESKFDFSNWGQHGLTEIEPLWLLKYLPNMPASHVAIYNDLRGPSNSLTVREASANLALGEATAIIQRGTADVMVAGATGSRIHPLRAVHQSIQEQLAIRDTQAAGGDPAKACRPFDADRTGVVLGEGAGVMILESLESAEKRGATIHGEILGYGSSSVASRNGVANYRIAIENVILGSLETAGMSADQIGHVHAHGLSTSRCDAEEASAIKETLGPVPVTAAKSYFGNLGAGSGVIELAASLMAQKAGPLFPVLNCENLDPACPINAVRGNETPAGASCLNLNVTPQGQASSLLVGAWKQ